MKRWIPGLLFTSSLFLIGCTSAPDFSLAGAPSGTLSGSAGDVAFNGSDMMKLNTVLSDLPGRKVEVYSKPDFVLTWQANGKSHTLSFFVEESLVYPGDFTEAWSKRMSGDAVVGGKLDAGTIAVLEQALSDG
ncbi:MAG: hypothetical protein ACI8RZ_007641 [Myxococcota bacterium]|jgi:hypothetical protein